MLFCSTSSMHTVSVGPVHAIHPADAVVGSIARSIAANSTASGRKRRTDMDGDLLFKWERGKGAIIAQEAAAARQQGLLAAPRRRQVEQRDPHRSRLAP